MQKFSKKKYVSEIINYDIIELSLGLFSEKSSYLT